MSTLDAAPAQASERTPRRGSIISGLWNRQLQHYPDNGPRTFQLGIVVLATIILYYELYVQGSVAPAIMQDYGMSFTYFVYIAVVGNLVGAFASLVAGLADRWGRSNLVAWGLGVTAALTLWGLPNTSTKFSYAAVFAVISFVEGIVLVATPALVRDFSPQVGRASAMGFWTLGPVLGSLAVSQVSSHTLGPDSRWQDQFVYCGYAGLVVFALALFCLRELSPRLRDQLMVSLHDRALIEARAKGIDVAAALRHPWRQVLKPDVVGSAFAISVFLLFYYAAVGFFVVYFTTVHGFTEKQANGLGNWFWTFDAALLVVVGLLSDKLRVRKPFMLVGGLGTIAMTIVFLSRTTAAHTSYYEFVAIISVLAAFMGIAYAPWMASFTETVEKRNPALTATGLAVWGWILRIVVAVSAFLVPAVVSSATPLVMHGAEVQALATKDAAQLKTASEVDPATLAALSANPNDATAGAAAVGQLMRAEGIDQATAIQKLMALAPVKNELAYLQQHGPEVQAAAADAPGQWQTWWWVCVGGQILFLPFIFVMAGRWSPRKAREDAEAHEALVAAELAQLDEQSATAPAQSTVGELAG